MDPWERRPASMGIAARRRSHTAIAIVIGTLFRQLLYFERLTP